ncbi:hypothetical protein SAMD00019534_007050 [Acytostelium subglobosum LB1]|uniref:hypothetical protein n=1 Tax=Acytostelium subglobosum LB1 TaxID=1410327 RepID=UPI000644EDF1|nr:hypothetical protein SAMD00019534_007050 [Acytostelium subglobosum LB1]GAM17530.1 hypothetical protein SAMD00019534_007050 [Acytostelium subglobosum LB1]|eukprot:XP_012759592.1 hypothetical protein SAMD00019534_007050 [Acytostelium subglobosum LB1]
MPTTSSINHNIPITYNTINPNTLASVTEYTENLRHSHWDKPNFENNYEEPTSNYEEKRVTRPLSASAPVFTKSKRKRLVRFFTLSREMIRIKLNLKRESYIAIMPTEILVNIVGFLDHTDIWNVMLVCREWMAVAQDEFLWKLAYQNYFVHMINRENFASQRKAANLDLHWREIFMREYTKEMKWSSDIYKEAYLYGHTGNVWSLAFDDQSGNVFSGSFDKTVKMWDIKKRKCIYTFVGHTYPVQSLDVQDDHMVTGSLDNSLRLWDLKKKCCKSILSKKAHHFDVYCLQMLDDSKLVSGSSDSTIKLWNLQDEMQSDDTLQDRQDRGEQQVNMTPMHTFKHESCVTCLQVRGNVMMSGGSDKVVRAWDLNEMKQTNVLSGHHEGIKCLQFEDNVVVTGANDSTVRLWDLRSNSKNGAFTTLRVNGSVRSLQWEGTSLITGSTDQTVRWWNLNTNSTIDLFEAESSISCLRFKDNLLLCGLGDSKIQMTKFV